MRRLARAFVGLLVLVAVLFVAGFPIHTYLDQRAALVSTSERLAVLKKGNRDLEARAHELHTDTAVERLAREQYNLVRPGEEAYAILPGPAAASPDKVALPPAAAKPGFWAQVVDKLEFWR